VIDKRGNRPRALFLSSWFPFPPDNGSRQRVYALLQGLAQDYHITLLALRDPEQSEDCKAEWCERVLTLPRRTYNPKRLAARAAYFAPQPRFLADTFDPAMRDLVRQENARAEYGVVIASQLSMAAYAAPLPHRAKIFEEVELGIFADAYERTHGVLRWRKSLMWFKFARYLRGLAKHFHALTVVSETERERLANLGIAQPKISILPNGVDCSSPDVDSVPSLEPFSLVYSGALTYDPNYDAVRYFVRDILPRVRAQEPRVRLRITGHAPQFAINELSQDNAVLFTGYLAHVRPLVQSSAVCIVPLREGGGTRLKVLEAMALGTPVVSTSKGIEGLDVRAGEHVLVGDTPQAFADAVVRVMQDNTLRARIAQAARERVCELYDWRVIQKQLRELVRRVTASQGQIW
jgi:glycosyltransferase involved in cell wall biosynthesis